MAAGNPIAAILARQLAGKLAGGGQQQGVPGGAMGAPQGAPPDQAGMQIQSQLAELQGADPNSLMKIMQQIKSQLVAIYPRAAFTIPEVSRNVAQAQKYLDTAIKECEKAVATQQTVEQGPIVNNAGQPPMGQPQGLEQFASMGS